MSVTPDNDALLFHKKNRGKITIQSTVPIKDRATLSLAYTPEVAKVSLAIAKDTRDAYTYTLKSHTVGIVSDGSAILGLGNLGALAAIPVMEGKAALFKEFAGIDAFPVCLDTQDTEEIIQIVKAIAPVFGAINLEDISAPRCFEIEERLRRELPIPVMHDDQHGTATVVLAGLINALTLRDLQKEKARVVINGAGAAGTAIAQLLTVYGFTNIVVCDTKGAIFSGRPDPTPEKEILAKLTNGAHRSGDLASVLIDADIFIGVSRGNLLTKEMIQGMNARPIIFALANPTPEIMPDEAKAAGAFIVATGRSDFPNQVNNALAYPGIFKGALETRLSQFTTPLFIRVAEAIARTVERPTPEEIIPDIFDRRVVENILKAF